MKWFNNNMKFEEIKILHAKLDKHIESRDSEKEDTMLATLASTEGWEILNAIAQDMIAELLEAPEFSDETPLDVRGSVYESRAFGIEILRKLLKIVTATKAAKMIEKQDANPQTEPQA